jgi:hypothetical protein
MNNIKAILKKTVLYKKLLKAKTSIRIFYNININKFKSDSKYENKNLSDIFKNIYLKKEWGDPTELGIDNNHIFFSGTGSYSQASSDYIEFIVSYVKSNKIKRIVDLGCGDFNIGKHITQRLPNVFYWGVDIFDEIINYNKLHFSSDYIQFSKIDTTKELVPEGDLLLIREVFQHLSNDSISKVINLQLNNFEKVLITECYPPNEYVKSYNLDKPDGASYRCDYGSAVFLDKPPFNLQISKVLSCPHAYFGNINTFEINK